MGTTKQIGIDIGGTKIHIGVVQQACIIQEIQVETSATASKEQILQELVDTIKIVIDDEVSGIGIGVPGLVDEKNGIVHNVQNIPSWQEVGLKQHLAEHFHQPVYMTNDANAFAIGEKIYGKGKAFTNLVGITLGTGFGTGIIINNDVYSGTLSSAGEFGSIPYRDKTIEDYCSGKFFSQRFNLSGTACHSLAKQGEAGALKAFAQYGEHLGNAIKTVLYALAPEAIFLGGSISKCYEFFQESMYESIQAFPFRLVTNRLVVAPSELGNAAVLGAAALCALKQGEHHPQRVPLH
ncbi:ROK family protein (plasmid) [Hymenobacter tibetensis]|uniref:ROK family protein n=1 Tax=Hymenobacter tibetensis TaxID=497967 RepID=A0ABY4D4T0_9BACT|nr:ROK family protein [Hymenobacter tibetensis]UOG77515.1 ROK family protein [Hymenobacter tibetensis]